MGIENKRINRACLAVATVIGGTLGLNASALTGDDTVTPQPPIGAPIDGLSRIELDRFSIGKTLYGTPLLIEDGLGPVLNKSNCRSCHSNPDGGPGNILVNHFGSVEKGEFTQLPGGTLLQLVAIGSGCEETLPPEANFTTNRVTPGMLGYGLVEAISDADLAANEDPEDANSDGISGLRNG